MSSINQQDVPPRNFRLRIAELEAERDRLRAAHERNKHQARKVAYDGRNHHCDWRKVAEAIIQRSEQALEEK